MTDRRYFKKEYEGEYYIFDTETISEKEFQEKLDYEGYQAFGDCLTGDETLNLLNELTDENNHIKNTITEMMKKERTAIGKSVLKQLKEMIQ